MSINRTIYFIYAVLIASLLTTAVLIFFPVNVSVQGDNVGPSPYRQEIDELYEITSRGLPPDSPEWARLEVLRLKNNEWFEAEASSQNHGGIVEYMKAKFLKLSPLLVVIWGLCFVILAKRSKYKA